MFIIRAIRRHYAAYRFKNPANGYVKKIKLPGGRVLILGWIWFLFHGMWRHAIIDFFFWPLVIPRVWYAFNALKLVREHYAEMGYIDIGKAI